VVVARTDAVTAYARQAVKAKASHGRFVLLAAGRHIRDLKDGKKRGLTFDPERAGKAVRFFSLLRHSKGQWAGQPFILAPWQAFIVGSLFGWRRADGTRRFRISYSEVPRKNGKSTLSSGIGLMLAFFDDEPGAEVYCAATKREQARIVFDEAKRMVERTPGLKRRIEVLVGNMHQTATASKLQPLSADHDTMDGLNVHGVIIDELHAHKTSSIVDVLETATGARRQPLQFEITTAGFDRNSICWKHHDYTVKVLEGTVTDDTWFGFIASADPGDDWRLPKTWAKANPNLGVSVKLDDLKRKAEKAEHIPAQQNAFRRLHLDEWTEQADRWIDMEVWDGCSGKVDEEALRERHADCFAGLDMASVRDLSALALVFPAEDDGFDVLWKFWLPRESLESGKTERSERERLRLQEWAEQGFITLTEGNVTDYDLVERDIFAAAEAFRVLEIAHDRWNITQLVSHLQNEFGTDEDSVPRVIGFGQGFQSMSAPTKELEKLLLGKKIRHGANPVARWMASNVAVREDPAGNMKPDKERSAEKIDGIVALVMALGRAITRPVEGDSIYDQRAATGAEVIDSW
jgi:phage terminase large subunit-like protein